MAWLPHLQAQLVSKGVTKCALIGAADGLIWADSETKISPQEAVACANLLKHPSEAFGLGVTVAGTKYLVTRASDEVIAARKGSNGLFLYKSNKAIVLALHDETMNAGTCSTYAGKACDYFKGLGF